MTSKRGGRPTKDAAISDNFNNPKVLTNKDIKEVVKTKHQIDGAKGGYLKKGKYKREDNLKAAYDMLLDLRYSYRNSVGPDGKKGRQRLVELMKSDTEFKFAVKELLKIESALMAAKIRKEVDTPVGGSQNFFVVLKGLESERPILSAIEDKTVDMKQIQRAINPDNTDYEPEEESQRDAPEQLHKSLESI